MPMEGKTMKNSMRIEIESAVKVRNANDIFEKDTKTGYIWGTDDRSSYSISTFIRNIEETKAKILNSIRKELSDNIEMITLSLTYPQFVGHAYPNIERSFRIISVGYNPSGYEIAEYNGKQYDLTHGSESQLTKPQVLKKAKALIDEYVKIMLDIAMENYNISLVREIKEKEEEQKQQAE
jgi:hypothetical protein